MLKVSRFAAHALALAVAGCGSDDGSEGPNIGGLYQVTRHTLNPDACDVEGADVVEPPYFRLERNEFFGAAYYAMSQCTGPESETCSGGGIGSFSFEVLRGGRWYGELFASSSSGEGGACSLMAVLSSAIPIEGGIRLEQREYSDSDAALTGDACDPDAARARGTAMPCSDFEVYEGTLLP